MAVVEAINKAVGEFPDLIKDSKNPHFQNTYISLGAVLDAIQPVLRENGLLLLQPLSNVGPSPALCTRIVHVESGEAIEDVTPLVLDKDSPQAVGSAITYFRRYALLSFFGLMADEDDDAESAGTTVRKKESSGKRGGF